MALARRAPPIALTKQDLPDLERFEAAGAGAASTAPTDWSLRKPVVWANVGRGRPRRGMRLDRLDPVADEVPSRAYQIPEQAELTEPSSTWKPTSKSSSAMQVTNG